MDRNWCNQKANPVLTNSFSFEFGSIQTEDKQSDDFEYMSEKYSTKNELNQEYTNCLGDEHTTAQLNLLESKISECVTESDVQSCVSEFVNIIHSVSSPLFKKTIKHDNKKSTPLNQNPWFNEACHDKKYCFLHMLDKYRKIKSDEK